MKSEIKITDRQQMAEIDIEGVIGVPEQMQFDSPGEKVATYARFADSLAQLRELRVSEVVVNIRSTGGDVNDALMIFDALKGLSAVVTTRCYGYVASAATIIAQAASVGRREISANALYLIHCSESVAEGNAHLLAQTKDLLDKTDIRIASIYAECAGRPMEEYIGLMNENGGKGRWINAEEVVGAGLADRIVPAPVRNKAGDDCDAMDEAAEFCRLFGLTPPKLPEGDTDIATESSQSLSRLRTLWRTFIRLFGEGDKESDGNAEIKSQLSGCDSPDCLTDVLPDNDCTSELHIADVEPLTKYCKDTVADGEGIAGVAEVKVTATLKTSMPSDKTVILERLSLQSDAFATSVVQVEDPSIDEQKKNTNHEAYEQDVMSLKALL